MAETQEISVSEAVERRMSVRAFRPDPVPAETVRALLNKARRAPSGGNVQPWKVDVLLGARLDDFKAQIQEKLARGELEEPQYDVYPKGL
ncbi:MAG: nitroreductase family protein, partial [Pseudomonadota bacterium]